MDRPVGIKEMIRAKLDAGLLPRTRPEKAYAGPASGRLCSACELPIFGNQIEYEFDAPDGRTFQRCVGSRAADARMAVSAARRSRAGDRRAAWRGWLLTLVTAAGQREA